MQEWQLAWELGKAFWTFCPIASSLTSTLTASMQPSAPPSFLVPYLISAFLLNPLGSATVTAVADYMRRVAGAARFFWRHWWHFPFLAGATWMVTWYLNGGFEVFPRNPLVTLLAVFIAIHLTWLLITEHAARRKREERENPKRER